MKKFICVFLMMCCFVAMVGCGAAPAQLSEEQKSQARMLYNWSSIWQKKTASGDLVNTIAVREVNGQEYLFTGWMKSVEFSSGSGVSHSYGVTWVFEITEKGVREVDEDSVWGLPDAGLVLTGSSGTRWDPLAAKEVKIAALEEAMLKSMNNKK